MSKQKYPQTGSSKTSSTSTPNSRKKTAGYCSDRLHAKRDQRRREADARQARYDALSLEDRLRLCHTRPGQTIRERARIQFAISKRAA